MASMATSILTATISILCLIIIIDNALACGGGGGWNIDKDIEDNSTLLNITEDRFAGNLADPSKWDDHWIPTIGLTVQDYRDWLSDYKKKQAQKEKNALDAAGGSWPEKPDGAGADWPEHWKALGPGSGGVPPPPWAYVKESSGKADMCFLSPGRGPCQAYVIRWGFNPYIDDCARFVYGGCDGNGNNFLTERRCREACVGVPSGNCVSGSDPILDFDEIPPDNL